jgi:preprotein translocase subunit SecA
MNYQRNAIYKRRQNALFGERLSLDIINILFDVCQDITTNYLSYEELELKVIELLGMEPPFSAEEFQRMQPQVKTEQLFLVAEKHYKTKNEGIGQQVIQVAKEAQRQGYSGIQVPITNGSIVTGIVVDAQKTIDSNGKEVLTEMEKFITLSLIDQEWKEHLREMDDLKQSVQNAVFEQKDPLLIYKFESVNLFQRFVARVNIDTISFVIKAEIPEVQSTNQSTAKAPKEKAPKLQLSKDEAISSLVGGLAGGSESENPGYHDPSQRSVERVAPRQAIKIADRNQRVTVQYMDGSTKENVKYKVVEQDVESGKAVVIA